MTWDDVFTIVFVVVVVGLLAVVAWVYQN